jgi:hypothetical protein
MDFSKFDKSIDKEGLKHDIEEVAENGGNFKEVPIGKYEVKVDKMELVQTGPKATNPGVPMVSIWFKILSGEYKNSLIFYNKVIYGTSNDAFMIHQVEELLRSLDSGLDVDFDSYSQFAQLLLDINEAIDGKLEYALAYGENNKGFKTYDIEEIFEVE